VTALTSSFFIVIIAVVVISSSSSSSSAQFFLTTIRTANLACSAADFAEWPHEATFAGRPFDVLPPELAAERDAVYETNLRPLANGDRRQEFVFCRENYCAAVEHAGARGVPLPLPNSDE
jgi:hypothetical protein